MPQVKPFELLQLDKMTMVDIQKLIDKENKRRLQSKAALERFNEKHRESGELSKMREEYKKSYYRKKISAETNL